MGSGLLGHFREHGVGAPFHLFRRHILDVGKKRPRVAEAVNNLALHPLCRDCLRR
jgi:hypothetical protein